MTPFDVQFSPHPPSLARAAPLGAPHDRTSMSITIHVGVTLGFWRIHCRSTAHSLYLNERLAFSDVRLAQKIHCPE